MGADTKDRKEVKTQIAKTIADEKSYTTELLSLPKKEKNDRLLNKKEHATDIESLNAKIDKKEKELKSIIKGIQADILSLKQTSQLGIQDDIRRIQDKIEEVNNDNDKQIGDAKIKRDKSIEKLGQQNDLISHTRTKIEEFQNEIARIKADKSNITKSNIVYSLATHLTFIEACEGAENPGDVTPKCRKITENFWFGIISFIVAVAGTAVAMGSEVLRTAHLRTNKQKPMRYMFAKILKGVTRPRIKIIEKPVEKIVEVTKVVPEDKVIFKEVPKIHEVIKKEIEYIPVPTTREELINKKNNKKDTK